MNYTDTLNNRTIYAKSKEEAWIELRNAAYEAKQPMPMFRDIRTEKIL